jgi:hypothetical protein
MKLLIMQLSPTSYHFIPLRSLQTKIVTKIQDRLKLFWSISKRERGRERRVQINNLWASVTNFTGG